jgi:ATP-dependent helicase/DNAse subunit B
VFVYDYKRTCPSRPGSFLTGDWLALFTYALALADETADPPATIGGCLLAPLTPSKAESGYVKDAPEPDQTMYLYRPAGFVAEDAVDLLDAGIGTAASPVFNVKKKKDGDLYATSHVCGRVSFDAWLDLAHRTISQAAGGLLAGRVEIEPLLEKKTLACRRCSFRPLCRFERGENVVRLAERDLPQRDGATDEGGNE